MKFTIPIQPITKKNHQEIVNVRGRPMLLQSKKYRDYEKKAVLFVPKLYLTGPVTVKALFYMQARRRVDLINLLEALDDVLVCGGLLVDDNCLSIPSHDGSRVFYDKINPRTEVEVYDYMGAMPWEESR